MMRLFLLAWMAALALFLTSGSALAHKPSDSYLSLNIDSQIVHVRWDIAIRDLDYAVDLDRDANGKITWSELLALQKDVSSYAISRLTLRDSQRMPCSTDTGAPTLAVATHSDGEYGVLNFDVRCPSALTQISIDYRLFFDIDPQHRGIVRIDSGGTSRTHVLSKDGHEARFDFANSGWQQQLMSMIGEGIFHIWTGYDHVLFLLALLLPSVLQREGKEWRPVPRLRPALMDVLRIVTAFTLAHSITLSLAGMGVVALPARLVESVIAASVVLAAVNNLYPILRQERWIAAFLLGLMHGFGFSSVLMDLDLPRSNLVLTLFGFNLGVEIGQVAIVLLFVPLAYMARHTIAYRRMGLFAGSAAIAVLASVWLIERALSVRIIPQY